MPLTRATRMEGYDAIRLRSASAHLDATFVPIAGMLGASLREGGVELLGRGLGVHCYARGGTTMGIPLLHPWANRLAADEYRVDGTDVHLRPDSPWSRATSAGCRSTGCWAARLIGGCATPTPTATAAPHGRSRPRSTSAPIPSCSRRSRSLTASRSTSPCGGAH